MFLHNEELLRTVAILTYRKARFCFPPNEKPRALGERYRKASFTVYKTGNIFCNVSLLQSRRVMNVRHVSMIRDIHPSHHWLVGTKVDTGSMFRSYDELYTTSHGITLSLQMSGFTVMSRIFTGVTACTGSSTTRQGITLFVSFFTKDHIFISLKHFVNKMFGRSFAKQMI